MVNPINSSIASALFGGGTTSGASGVDADLLTAWARAKSGVGVDAAAATQDPNAPLAPVWTPGVSPSADALVQRALSNKPFFDVGAKLYSDLGATGDYRRLFALYSGLTTLQALAGRAEDAKLSAADQTKTSAQFARGLTELEAFFASQQFEDIRLAQGDRVDSAQTTLAMPAKSEDYQTGYIHRGGLYEKLAGLDPDAQFTITATSSAGAVRTVAIDLSEMGSLTRTFSNVLSFINGKLAAAGAASRLEAADITPKESSVVVAGKTVSRPYTGPKQYALKVDVRAGEKVAFAAAQTEPAFYAVGTTASGARLIKLADVGGDGGQPAWLDRPVATDDPIGAYVSTGWFGPGAPYASAPAGAWAQQSGPLASTAGSGNVEAALRAAGDAVLKLETPDGRAYTVTTSWRSEDLEAWRARTGESEERAMLGDLAERLTQLMHEQGLAAGVEVWESGTDLGLSVVTGDQIRASSLSVGGLSVDLNLAPPASMTGGLRDGVYARRFEAAGVAAATDLFKGEQKFVISTASTTRSITIGGGTAGIDAATLMQRLNDQLRDQGLPAAAELVDNAGVLSLHVNALHDVVGVSATLNGAAYDGVLQAPGAWASGGLPAASAGQPFGDALRSYTASASPLLSETGAVDIAIVVATATGDKTINVSVSAQERLDDPDPAPGEWSAAFQARLDAALNAAGVYAGATSSDLTQWSVAEDAGQRLKSVTVNGSAMAFTSGAPAFALGGAFGGERSFTSAQAATGVSDDVAALISDPTVSVTFDTVWGQRTVSATLDVADPPTLESAALRLNEALAAQGYDLGVVATDLSGGGAGLRLVTGASHTVRGVGEISLGGVAATATLDPIDSVSHADDPVGAAGVTARATRGAAVTLTIPADSAFSAPSANASAWFPGRAFDVSVGGGLQIATARATAAAGDGSVYVLVDLAGDSASSAIKGARDVALLKYDSAGKLVFSEMLGASQSASGFALAVSADGKVAVGGAIEGALSGTNDKGGLDSFVTLFDAGGKELWTARRGASANDQVSALAFGSDGSLYVAGKTDPALSGQVGAGGSDGYVRGYSSAGAELFTRQFGTGGDDAATALAVRDDGAGGFDIFSGGVENNRGVVRRFSYSSATGFSVGASRDIGYFYKGAVNAIAVDGASLYVGGEIGADRLTLGTPAAASVAAQEGFVARLDAGLVSTALDRASYLGSAQDDAVKSLAIVGGEIYAAGTTGGLMAAQGIPGAKSSFLVRVGADGEAAWTRTFNSLGGAFALTGLAVDQTGASALDALGLPRGQVAAADAGLLADRSALRVGDEFKLGVDGRSLTTIKIGAKDTLASLVNSINRAIAGAGRASIVRDETGERIKITPSGDKAVRVDPGRAGKDALGALGLKQGVVAAGAAGRGALKTYGLGLIAADLRLDTKGNITSAKAELSAAVSIVRQAYDYLLNPNAKEQTAEEKALAERRQNAGQAPAYLTAQLANYRAALTRLGGG